MKVKELIELLQGIEQDANINTLNVLEKISSTLKELVNEFKTMNEIKFKNNNSKVNNQLNHSYNKRGIGEKYIPKFSKGDIIESINNQPYYMYRVSEVFNDYYALETLDDNTSSQMFWIMYVDKFYQQRICDD